MSEKFPNKPIPVKLGKGELALLKVLKYRSELKISQIIRRSVRLLGQEIKRRGKSWLWIEETAREFNDPAVLAEAAALSSPADHLETAVADLLEPRKAGRSATIGTLPRRGKTPRADPKGES